MAKKTQTLAELIAELEDEVQYGVELLRPIQVGRSWARPGTEVHLKGKVIKENADGIASVYALTA